MKCSRITLFDRSEPDPRLKNVQKQCCDSERSFQPHLPTYLSWITKPVSVYEEQPYLNICNLALPSNVVVFIDRGAQSDRWVHKRPRLKSGKLVKRPKSLPQSPEPEEEEEEDRKSENEEKDSELMEIHQVLQEYDIDDNVQRLIQEAAEYDNRMAQQSKDDSANNQEEPHKRKSKKHKTKEARHNETKNSRVRLNRTMTLSLSRPPSPETIQVIRVDVTSNYSLDELRAGDYDMPDEGHDGDDEEDAESFMGDREPGDGKLHHERNQQTQVDHHNSSYDRNRLYRAKSILKNMQCHTDLALKCQKLALVERKQDNENAKELQK